MTRMRSRSALIVTSMVALVGLYLVWWSTYAALHLDPPQFDQLPSGQSARDAGADFQLISLRRSENAVSVYDDVSTAPVDAVWVVAELTVTKREVSSDLYCSLTLVGADRRTWEKDTLFVPSRELPRCLDDDALIGSSTTIEAAFVVSAADADQLVGVALPGEPGKPRPVLTP